ncbi:MAG: hypothetical protein WCY05_04730 [Candidatus Omnitrophota bacterium]
MKIFAKILIFSLFLSPAQAFGADVKELYSDHFIIISDKSIDQEYIYKVKNMAEDFYKIVTQEFNFIRVNPWLWKSRAKIFIAKDKDEYAEKYNCPSWSNACVDYHDKRIFTYPQQKDFSSTLSHELTHIIFREYVGKEQLPLWLDEGISVYVAHKYEKKQNEKAFSLLKQKIQSGGYIKFSELNNMNSQELEGKPREYVDTFYLESFSIINFLVKKWSRYNLNNFFKFLKDGFSVTESLCKSYNIRTLEELEKQWIRFYQI